MKVKCRILIIFILLTCPILGFSTVHFSGNGTNLSDTINAFDSNGKKTGLWLIDSSPGYKHLINFEGGLINGFEITLSNNNRIVSSKFYIFGEPGGMWYEFGNKGELLSTTTKFQKNTEKFINPQDSSKIHIFNYIAFFTYFYPNGQIKEEGWGYTDDGTEYNFIKLNDWIYFNDDGTKIQK